MSKAKQLEIIGERYAISERFKPGVEDSIGWTVTDLKDMTDGYPKEVRAFLTKSWETSVDSYMAAKGFAERLAAKE